ncbi:MAG: radical SAM protein [Bifidobacteriaceae bacterium]|jgi:23S rRNA (adenine2503-C2)-methyltransferase|nr:radical SAM protein [Bifidobacteriaceae bacterium]
MHFVELLNNKIASSGTSINQSGTTTSHKNQDPSEHATLSKMRMSQLSNQYFAQLNIDPNTWTNIPKDEREQLSEYFPEVLKTVNKQIGDGGDTIKYLYELTDGSLIESVIMKYYDEDFSDSINKGSTDGRSVPNNNNSTAGRSVPNKNNSANDKDVSKKESRATLCISCQVGCAMACPFCATGKLGLKRNLSLPELTEQIRLAKLEGVTNIVFMGMGEPTQNLKNIEAAVRAADKFGIFAKNITISTVGIPDGINELADFSVYEKFPFRLAISLHAGTNLTRDKLIPINKKYPIDEVLDAAFAFFKKTTRRVSIEYLLAKGVNDTEKEAYNLAKVLNRRGSNWAHVNIIPLNEVEGSDYFPSDKATQDVFINALKSKGIFVTVRESRGSDIDGACGQLASKPV